MGAVDVAQLAKDLGSNPAISKFYNEFTVKCYKDKNKKGHEYPLKTLPLIAISTLARDLWGCMKELHTIPLYPGGVSPGPKLYEFRLEV